MPAPKMSPPSFYLPGKKGEPKPVPGAIAWYRFDEGSGQILHDYSGNGNHGYLGSQPTGVDTNDPTWDEKGLVFGGDDQVIGNPAMLQNANPYTVICVFNIPTGVTGVHCFMSKKLGTNQTLTTGFVFDYSVMDRAIRLIQNDVDINLTQKSASVPFTSDSKWHCAIGVYDGSGVMVQLDGVKSSKTSCGYTPALTQILGMGRLSYTSAYFLTGGISASKIFPFALSDSQAAQEIAFLKYDLNKKGVILP